MCRKAVEKGVLRDVTFNYEKGTKQETPHIHIFAQSKEKMRTKAWQKALGGRVGGIIATRFVPDAGELSYHGKRTDLEDAVQQIKEGTSINQLIETMPGTVANGIKNTAPKACNLGWFIQVDEASGLFSSGGSPRDGSS